jgi:hypothetical protein
MDKKTEGRVARICHGNVDLWENLSAMGEIHGDKKVNEFLDVVKDSGDEMWNRFLVFKEKRSFPGLEMTFQHFFLAEQVQ